MRARMFHSLLHRIESINCIYVMISCDGKILRSSVHVKKLFPALFVYKILFCYNSQNIIVELLK